MAGLQSVFKVIAIALMFFTLQARAEIRYDIPESGEMYKMLFGPDVEKKLNEHNVLIMRGANDTERKLQTATPFGKLNGKVFAPFCASMMELSHKMVADKDNAVVISISKYKTSWFKTILGIFAGKGTKKNGASSVQGSDSKQFESSENIVEVRSATVTPASLVENKDKFLNALDKCVEYQSQTFMGGPTTVDKASVDEVKKLLKKAEGASTSGASATKSESGTR